MVKRVTVIGPSHVGKTSIILQHTKKMFTDTYMSTMFSDVFEDSNNNIIWDTAGNSRWLTSSKDTIKKSKGLIVCFCPNKPDTFDQAMKLLEYALDDIPCIFAATKSDIKPFAIRPEWSRIANSKGAKIIRTSALTGEGIPKLFEEIFSKIESDKIVLGSVEYAKQQIGSCIYSGVNNYIYGLDTDAQ